jgi:hypothetical protein
LVQRLQTQLVFYHPLPLAALRALLLQSRAHSQDSEPHRYASGGALTKAASLGVEILIPNQIMSGTDRASRMKLKPAIEATVS